MDAPNLKPDESLPVPVGRLVRITAYGLGFYLLVLVLFSSMPKDDPMAVFGEGGRVETAQVVLLALMLLISVMIFFLRPASRPLSNLAVGFFVAVLVREHNEALKRIDPNLWKISAGVVLAATCLWAWHDRPARHDALRRFVRSDALLWCAAAVIAHRFAAALDEREIWEPILGSDVPFVARRLAEEAGELLAYALLLFGMVEWWFAERTTVVRDGT